MRGDKEGIGAERCFKPAQELEEGKSVTLLLSFWGSEHNTALGFLCVQYGLYLEHSP